MKKIVVLVLFSVAVLVPNAVWGQAQELKQLALDIEKLAQFRAILKDMKQGYQILTKGYNQVRDLSRGNFDLHQAFLDGLLQVSTAVRDYPRITAIIESEGKMAGIISRSRQRFNSSGLYGGEELGYFSDTYGKLLDESLQDLSELTDILTAGKYRMSDRERLENIDRIYRHTRERELFLRDFTNSVTVLGLQRAQAAGDVTALRMLTGITH